MPCDNCIWRGRPTCRCEERRSRLFNEQWSGGDLAREPRGRRVILYGDDSSEDEWQPPASSAEQIEQYAHATLALAHGQTSGWDVFVLRRQQRLQCALERARDGGDDDASAFLAVGLGGSHRRLMGVVQRGWLSLRAEEREREVELRAAAARLEAEAARAEAEAERAREEEARARRRRAAQHAEKAAKRARMEARLQEAKARFSHEARATDLAIDLACSRLAPGLFASLGLPALFSAVCDDTLPAHLLPDDDRPGGARCGATLMPTLPSSDRLGGADASPSSPPSPPPRCAACHHPPGRCPASVPRDSAGAVVCQLCSGSLADDAPWVPPPLAGSALALGSDDHIQSTAVLDGNDNLLTMAGVDWSHRQLEQWLDPGSTFDSQDDVSAWAWHPAAEDAVSYAYLDIASWPGPICDVCYASTCAVCGYVFADVGEASPSRTTRRRLACVGCAEWGVAAPMFGPDWETLTAAPPPSEGGVGAP